MSLDPLGQIHPVTIAGVMVIFLVTLLLLRRLIFLPLIDVMERRRARVAAALAGQAAAQALVNSARREAEAARSRAQDRAEQVVSRMQQETAERCQARMAEASRQAESILAEGRKAAQLVAHAEAARLREELVACVSATLNRVTGSSDEAAVRFMVNRVLAEQKAG